MPIELRWIQHGSADYTAMVDLRDAVLRIPLGLRIDRSKLEQEKEYGLLTAWDGDRCVGTMVLTHDDESSSRMRAVAVDPDYQGQGIGRLMDDEFVKESRRRGYTRIFLHARIVSVPFYLRTGYSTFGEEFTEVSVPHVRMEKQI